jgi:hypothetical protein
VICNDSNDKTLLITDRSEKNRILNEVKREEKVLDEFYEDVLKPKPDELTDFFKDVI